MRFYIRLGLWVLVFAGAATLLDVNIPVLYDNEVMSPIFMACLDIIVRGVTTMLFLIPAIAFGMFWTFFIIFLASFSDEDVDDEVAGGLLIILTGVILAPLMIIFYPYIMTAWILPHFAWAIQFTYWQYASISLIVLFASGGDIKSMITSASNKTKKESGNKYNCVSLYQYNDTQLR